MADFPTLSIHPTKVEREYEDSTIRSTFEAGFELTRNQYTRDRSTFTVNYGTMGRVDKDLLIEFLGTVRGAEIFTWKNHDEEIPLSEPKDYVSYNVRFKEFPMVSAVAGRYGLYDISFVVREV